MTSSPSTIEQLRLALEQEGSIAILWSVDDVRCVRSDLNHEQAWQVLQACRHNHDANSGISWDVLAYWAHELFPNSSNDSEAA